LLNSALKRKKIVLLHPKESMGNKENCYIRIEYSINFYHVKKVIEAFYKRKDKAIIMQVQDERKRPNTIMNPIF